MFSRRSPLHALILAAVFGAGQLARPDATLAGPPPDWIAELITDRAAAHGVSAVWITSTLDCEGGGTWQAGIVGAAGELGPAQLHPRGELQHFYARGYTDPFSWWQATDFIAARFSEGGSGAWTCA